MKTRSKKYRDEKVATIDRMMKRHFAIDYVPPLFKAFLAKRYKMKEV